jgi:hypothetical protein
MEAQMNMAYALWCLSEWVADLPPPWGMDSLLFTGYGNHSHAQSRESVPYGQRSL